MRSQPLLLGKICRWIISGYNNTEEVIIRGSLGRVPESGAGHAGTFSGGLSPQRAWVRKYGRADPYFPAKAGASAFAFGTARAGAGVPCCNVRNYTNAQALYYYYVTWMGKGLG